MLLKWSTLTPPLVHDEGTEVMVITSRFIRSTNPSPMRLLLPEPSVRCLCRDIRSHHFHYVWERKLWAPRWHDYNFISFLFFKQFQGEKVLIEVVYNFVSDWLTYLFSFIYLSLLIYLFYTYDKVCITFVFLWYLVEAAWRMNEGGGYEEHPEGRRKGERISEGMRGQEA